MPSLGFLSLASLVLAFFGWRIAARAGFSPLWGLTALVPPLGILALWYLAFSPWSRDQVGHERRSSDGAYGRRRHTASAYARTETRSDAEM